MTKDRQWYLDWHHGAAGYERNDRIRAVGLQCVGSAFPLQDVLSWLGKPDKVSGSPVAGHLAYYFDDDPESAALFDITDGQVKDFGTITRSIPNAKRPNAVTGEEDVFNILDEMTPFIGSSMQKKTEPKDGV